MAWRPARLRKRSSRRGSAAEPAWVRWWAISEATASRPSAWRRSRVSATRRWRRRRRGWDSAASSVWRISSWENSSRSSSGASGEWGHEPGPFGLVEGVEEGVGGEFAEGLEELVGEGPPDDGGGGERPAPVVP